ncbi:hypothetical protein NKR23_g979 [Pleurostoma richardsiae]|uniref:Transcription factor domain-containing protein n=1 Tax=Pleurostoma richardsiae TaxID=41990 RepID=A0AA38VWM4_9PEZI|nr:hypothetical protein NKR23_g979 [Pleurostoma richardsiae]
MGRELGLHRIDHPHGPPTFDPIQAEVGRRTWWHLAATDWFLAARYSGPNEGVYQTDPRRMTVKRPCNADDDDLSRGDYSGKPSDQATVMSYFLQRLRLAEISRDLVDRNLLSASIPGMLSYDALLEADNELEAFSNGIPSFFRLRRDDASTLDVLGGGTARSMIMQRYFINSLFQTQRCRLHLPYLARAATDPTHTFSRTACVRAARLIIQAELYLEREKIPFAETRLKLTGALYGVFIASIALLVDLCLSGAASQQEIRRGEVGEAIRILEDAARQSDVAAALLQSMIEILRKNGAAVPGTGSPIEQKMPGGADRAASLGWSFDAPVSAPAINEKLPSSRRAERDGVPAGEVSEEEERPADGLDLMGTDPDGVGLASYFDGLAQSWGDGMGVDDTAWNTMLSELETSFL